MRLEVIWVVSVSGQVVHRDMGVIGVQHSIVDSLSVDAHLAFLLLQLFVSF